MRSLRHTLAALAVAVVAAASLIAAPPSTAGAAAETGCRVLTVPASLGATLLALHLHYMQHQPDVHHVKLAGPVGRVHLGICGTERYALADFDATYNGLDFGIQDQPERFTRPAGRGWRDIGNTGGDPCGAAPTALLVAWKIVRSCPA